MNEKIDLINLSSSGGEKIALSVENFSGFNPSIQTSGIKEINLENIENIYINGNEYKEIVIGQSGGKILGNIEAGQFINNQANSYISNSTNSSSQTLSSSDGIYVNGIKFIPDYIIVDGVTKMILMAEE